MAQLSLQLLGSLLVTLDGNPPAVPLWDKSLALLVYLALEPDRPHRREALAGLFWPEQPEAAARGSLRQALYLLQQALGEEFFLITARTVQLNPASRFLVDVATFRALVEACRRHPHRAMETCSACVERLEAAAALYRGDLLADFLLKDSIAFEEWALLQREQLQRQALQVLHTLAGYYARRGDYARMEEAARRQVALDPLDEQAHRQLLQALAWSGHPNAAVAHYHSLVALLQKELDVPPEGPTVALYEQIRAGALATPPPPPRYNWPVLLAPLLGREEKLAQLADWLQAPAPRLITIVGTGGVGKTRLALAAAEQEPLLFADGICFVSLAAVRAPELILPAIANTLHFQVSRPRDPLGPQLFEYLASKDLLLVLDNLEQLLEGVVPMADMLAACPRLTILATSREPLRLRAEQLLSLEPLPVPGDAQLRNVGPAQVDALASFPSVRLFVQRAQAVRPGFALTPENAVAVAEICVRLDGLPLAIELAAAHACSFAPEELLAQLGHRLELLTGGARDLPLRQQTLRATLDWSYSLLNEREKRLFARMATFAGGGTIEAINAVCLGAAGEESRTAGELSSLLQKSLLQSLGGRFSMLETIREYAWERLAEKEEQAFRQRRHADYYLSVAEQGGMALSGPNGQSLMAMMEVERDNLHAALQWALGQRETLLALRLVGVLWYFWYFRGEYTEGARWIEAVLRLPLPAASSPERLQLEQCRVDVLTGAGAIAEVQERYAQAVAFLEEAADLARQNGNGEGLPRVLAWLGRAAQMATDLDRAQQVYEEALALARAGGPARRPTVAFCLNMLGEICHDRGDAARARSYYEESLSVWREVGSADGIACALCNLGLLTVPDDPALGIDLFRSSLRLAWENKDHSHLAYSLFGLAMGYQAQGRSVKAARLLGQCEALYRSIDLAPVPSDHSSYESTVSAARAALGEEDFATVWTQGQAMSIEEAVQEALADD